MNNKKSLLQDSLQELENIKNESLELAKEQLINESADLLEKKSAALFEKLIAGEDIEEEEEEEEEEESDEESLNEILNELKNVEDEESDEEMGSDDEEMDSDDEEEMDSEEESQISLDALRKAAEEQGFKLVQADSDEEEEMDSDEEEMDSDEEEMDSDEEEMDSDDEEDIEFNDDDEFSDVDVDDKVLAEPSDDEEEEEEESFKKINENFKRNNTKMKNTKKQVLKDLRDVSFNKLVEAYYNMDENDSFVVKENYGMEDEMGDDYEWSNSMPQLEGMDDEAYGMEDEGYGMEDEGYGMEDEGYGMEDEDIMYEIDMPEGGYNEPMSDESWHMDEMTDEDLNQMLSEMDVEETMHDVEDESGMRDLERESVATRTRDNFRHNPGMPKGSIAQRSELEEMFEEMSLEELQEMEQMLREDGDMAEGGDYQDNDTSGASMSGNVRFKTSAKEDYMNEQDLTEAEIEEMLSSMKDDDFEEEGMEESSLRNAATKINRGNQGAMPPSGRPHRQSGILGEEEMEDESDVQSLQEQLKKLRQENKALNEGFTNKVKSLENKVYDVTISALKAGFVNKFLLEHPLRENEKLQIIHRFANAQTKEQIKETYISLTNEFAKGQTVKDGSMLNESVQNKVGKVHRTDNVVVTEKNLMNENDESNRFKQLLNYNFGKKK